MKKLLIVLAIGLIVFGLSGCNSVQEYKDLKTKNQELEQRINGLEQ